MIRFNFTQNKSLNKLLNSRLFQHTIYWLALVCFFGFFWGFYNSNFKNTFRNEIVGLPVKMAVVYFILYVLIPRFLYTKRYPQFVSLLVLSMLTGGFANQAIYTVYVYPSDTFLQNYMVYQVMHRIVDINTILVIPVTVKLFKNWYRNQHATQILEKKKLEAELNFLKSQIHPHFFFNTLNNLYSLILKNNNEKAIDVVLKLSDLMRYMLYETRSSEIALSKEIVYIKNYITLEKIRFGERIEVSFHTYGDLGGQMIVPMIILPFIENSFKHSTAGNIDKAWITIEISVTDQIMSLIVENSVNRQTLEKKTSPNKGIGLENVARRLSLLYHDNYSLKIEDEEDTFSVILKIDLNKKNKLSF